VKVSGEGASGWYRTSWCMSMSVGVLGVLGVDIVWSMSSGIHDFGGKNNLVCNFGGNRE